MADAKKFTLDDPSPLPDEEDDETLAAIDEGIRDAGAGRVVPAEEIRKLMPQWITASSSPKEH
jgi:predicted transcriptional regulator